ncbi:MAG: GAF domain-containing protein [Acidobacteria bacterium]|nr:GAF domain-containing protein [Acidobacteriota bacterium]MBI3483621.1 GAF domain-containing protein [Acidobacteriota bacterium]
MSTDKLATDVTKVVDELVKAGEPIPIPTLGKLGQQIAKAFAVKEDEFAVLALIFDNKFLKFVVPEKLQNIGTIPVTSTTALAARTARDKRPEVINNFAIAKHSTVFEAVPLGDQRGDPIQKIMSAPVLADNKVIGVIQVSRKGKTQAAAGPDFTPKELGDLVAVSVQIGRCLKLCPVS